MGPSLKVCSHFSCCSMVHCCDGLFWFNIHGWSWAIRTQIWVRWSWAGLELRHRTQIRVRWSWGWAGLELNWGSASTVSILKAAWCAWPLWLDYWYVLGLTCTWEVLQFLKFEYGGAGACLGWSWIGVRPHRSPYWKLLGVLGLYGLIIDTCLV